MDQKQAGAAAVSRARFNESADGDAVGLFHLEPAKLDSPAQAADSASGRIKKD
jgi:hypothetical protein